MSEFSFQAARADGRLIRGRLRATSIREVTLALAQQGLVAVRVSELARRTRDGRGSPAHVAIALRAIGDLLDAGLPVHQALALAERYVPSAIAAPLRAIERRVREGISLSAAIAAEPVLATAATVGLISAAERGPGLAEGLRQAATHLDRRSDVANRLRTALAYPAVICIIGAISMTVVMLGVVPRFAVLLADSAATLPLSTRVLMACSSLLRASGPAMAAGAGIAVLAAFAVARNGSRRDRILSALPLVGAIRRTLAFARAARTLGTLLETGVPALGALRAAEDSAANSTVVSALAQARNGITRGAPLGQALAGARALSPRMLEIALLGDRAGLLPQMLQRAADLEEQEVEQRIRILVSLLEPAVIVVFAGMVALVASALLQGLYSIRPS